MELVVVVRSLESAAVIPSIHDTGEESGVAGNLGG
jgi:hypothetical protein